MTNKRNMQKKLRKGSNVPPDATEQDDRTLAPMNVEGMPWYSAHEPSQRNENAEPLQGRNLVRYTLYAVLSGLSIIAVFGLVAAAFIWFCVNVWFQ